MQLAEAFGIRCLCFLEVAHRTFTEEEAEHGTDAARCDRQACGGCRLLDPFNQLFGGCREFVVAARLFEQLKRFDACRHGEGISAQSAGLIHRSSRSNHLHDFASSAVGPHGQAASDHLAHGGQIRCHPEVGLGTSVADAETCHHLVKDQQGAVLLGEFTQALQEARLRLDEPRIADDGLEDHT